MDKEQHRGTQSSGLDDEWYGSAVCLPHVLWLGRSPDCTHSRVRLRNRAGEVQVTMHAWLPSSAGGAATHFGRDKSSPVEATISGKALVASLAHVMSTAWPVPVLNPRAHTCTGCR